MSEQADPVLEKLTTDPALLTGEDIAASGLTVEIKRNNQAEQPAGLAPTNLADVEAQLGRALNETEREILARKQRMSSALEELRETTGKGVFANTLPAVSTVKGKSESGRWITTLDYNGTLGGGAPSAPLRVPGIINRTPKN